jgi:ABC-type molybdenum transport system ATPase subunit/photorepair protein PhrA
VSYFAGSGKTTLLSMLMGDHPQSYTQPHLYLFGKKRSQLPTAAIASSIGIISPEVFDAFPRRAGMTVRDVIGTGFDNVFVPARGFNGMGEKLDDADIERRKVRIDAVLQGLWWKPQPLGDFPNSDFVDLSTGEQRIVMLMRALVGRKPLILLDEAWSGMDEDMIRTARAYLRGDGLQPDQAAVVITHWEAEVPWRLEDGLKKLELPSSESKPWRTPH